MECGPGSRRSVRRHGVPEVQLVGLQQTGGALDGAGISAAVEPPLDDLRGRGGEVEHQADGDRLAVDQVAEEGAAGRFFGLA